MVTRENTAPPQDTGGISGASDRLHSDRRMTAGQWPRSGCGVGWPVAAPLMGRGQRPHPKGAAPRTSLPTSQEDSAPAPRGQRLGGTEEANPALGTHSPGRWAWGTQSPPRAIRGRRRRWGAQRAARACVHT